MKTAKYYPGQSIGARPIHEVISHQYVRTLVREAKKGNIIPPILVDGEIGNCNLLAGTHRLAANELLQKLGQEPLIPVREISTIPEPYRSEILDAVESDSYSVVEYIFLKSLKH